MAPMLICFNSLSSSICIKDVDRCWQADMQAVWATFPCLKQISKPKNKQRKKQTEISHKVSEILYTWHSFVPFLGVQEQLLVFLFLHLEWLCLLALELKLIFLFTYPFQDINIIKTLTPHRKIKTQVKNSFRSLEMSHKYFKTH